MNLSRGRRILASLLLCILLLTTACAAKAPSRFDAVQQESTKQRSGQAVSKNATQGSKLNAFFPKSEDGYNRVYTQEKKGFSEANLKKGGHLALNMPEEMYDAIKNLLPPTIEHIKMPLRNKHPTNATRGRGIGEEKERFEYIYVWKKD